MAMKFSNNAATTLAQAIGAADVSLTINATSSLTGFPALGAGDYFYCTLQNQVSQAVEIVKVTAIANGTTFTIVRGQDGTTAQAFNMGDRVELRIVAATLNDIPKLDEANVFTQAMTVGGALTANGGIVAGPATGLTFADGSVISSTKQLPYSLVRNCFGQVNAGTPLTKYDLGADVVVTRDSKGQLNAILNGGTKTCDLGLAGPAANGRDQAAAFAASSWVYVYFIYNPTTQTLATLASLTAPATFTGATLPAGYTGWALATILRWNGSSNIIPGFTQGNEFFYDVADGGVLRAVSGGQATTMTAVDLSALAPPNVAYAKLDITLSFINTGTLVVDVYIRKSGASTINGRIACRGSVQTSTASTSAVVNSVDFPLGGQKIDYRLDAVPGGGGGLYLDVQGYALPNGDV